MHFCPFETVVKQALGLFSFMFSGEDFQIYEYAWDLEKFYCTGCASYPSTAEDTSSLVHQDGGPLGAVQGVGYLNELIECLTNLPTHHGLQTNKTLLSSPKTFPLNRKMYVDFSHDNLMVAVFAAMGLFKQPSGPLDATKINEDRTWIISKMVPFSGQMTVERLFCSPRPRSFVASGYQPMSWWNWTTTGGGANSYDHEPREGYVRIFVNDARQPLEFCGAGEDGMCRLDESVRTQGYARNDGFGDFERCNHTGW